MSIEGCIQNEISNSEAEIEQVGVNDLEDKVPLVPTHALVFKLH